MFQREQGLLMWYNGQVRGVDEGHNKRYCRVSSKVLCV
jgi:hypothetical protein